MKFRHSYIFLLLLGIVIGYLVYYYIYPEILFETILKQRVGKNLTLNCWGYQFITTQTSRYMNQSLTPKQRVDFLRELLNQNYTNFMHSSNITNPGYYIGGLVSQASSINLVDSVYNILKDTIPRTQPNRCKAVKSAEDVSKVLLVSATMANSGTLAYSFSTITHDWIWRCRNVTDKKKCISYYLDQFRTIAEKKKNSLPTYREVKLTKCTNTLFYLQLKDLEKLTREQLTKSKDPFSVMWKSLQIGMYDDCSQEVYDKFIKKHGCPIIPPNKVDSVRVVISEASIFTNCSSSYLQNEFSVLKGELNITRP